MFENPRTGRQAGDSLRWDHFEILAKGLSDTHCKIKVTLLIKDLKPTLNEYVSSEKLSFISFCQLYCYLIFNS